MIPGLGQVYAGQPRKGALFLLAILPTFLVGWWLTDFSAVQPTKRTLEFLAQVLLGGPTVAAASLSEGRMLEELPRFLDVGRLYTWVAGLLNVVAICDAIGEVIQHNRTVDALWLARQKAAPVEPPEVPPAASDTHGGDGAPPEQARALDPFDRWEEAP